MKQLHLTHQEYNTFRTQVLYKMIFDIKLTNPTGVIVIYEDNDENNIIIRDLGY